MLDKDTFKKYLGSILSNFGEVDYKGYDYIKFKTSRYKMNISFKGVFFKDKKIILNVGLDNTFYRRKNKEKDPVVHYGYTVECQIGVLKGDKIYITSGFLEPAKKVMDIIHSLEIKDIQTE